VVGRKVPALYMLSDSALSDTEYPCGLGHCRSFVAAVVGLVAHTTSSPVTAVVLSNVRHTRQLGASASRLVSEDGRGPACLLRSSACQ
jgi:hypothetical protein